MDLDASLLVRTKVENLELLARRLRVALPLHLLAKRDEYQRSLARRVATAIQDDKWQADEEKRLDPATLRENRPLPAPSTGVLVPPLPERVLCVSLWQPYACLCVAGVKTLETRTWPWPYPPSWLVIHASKREPDPATATRLHDLVVDRVPAPLRLARGALLGLVYVAAPSRPLLPEDKDAACFYEPGRFAWPLERPRPFARPVPIPRGPQKFVYLPRADVVGWAEGLVRA